MLTKPVIRKMIFSQRRLIFSFKKEAVKASIDIDKLDAEGGAATVVEESDNLEQELQFSRNKSGLNQADYNKLHHKVPYPEQLHWSHSTLKYKQKIYGIYGTANGFDPSCCWPTREELQRIKERENVAYPNSIQEVAELVKTAREERKEQIWKRQNEIKMRMEKLDIWKQELQARITKKENEALDAKLRKDRLVEDVRRHFGYIVDPKSDKFKEMLEKKEKEQKKMMKEARRNAKEAKMLGKISEGLGSISDGKEKSDSQFTKADVQD